MKLTTLSDKWVYSVFKWLNSQNKKFEKKIQKKNWKIFFKKNANTYAEGLGRRRLRLRRGGTYADGHRPFADETLRRGLDADGRRRRRETPRGIAGTPTGDGPRPLVAFP